MLTFILTLLKYGLMAVGAVLGVHGIMHDYKADGRLTREGRKAITVMIIVGVLTVLAAALEQYAAHLEYREKVTQEILSRPLKDLTLKFAISPDQAKAFEAAVGNGGPQGDPHDILTYLKTGIRAGDLDVRKTFTGWRAEILLNRPQGGPSSRVFSETSAEWRIFERALQKIIGDRLTLSLNNGARVQDLAGAAWPMEFHVRNGTISFHFFNPNLSPLDLQRSGLVLTHRGKFRPAEIQLTSSDPRVSLVDLNLPLVWGEKAYGMTMGPEGDPEPIFEHVTAPLRIEPAALKPVRP
jgi:hypothetical protein